ncbi:hypothetical protein EON64_20375, partial [archaeon]
MTLTFQVKQGYRLTLSSFSFYNRSTADPSTGYKNWRMTINGTEVGADTLQRQSVPLLSTGTLAIAGPMSALTGTVTVVLYFSNSIGGTGTVRIDNFVLNGFVQQIPNSSNAPITSLDGKGYRYGFNGKEYDNEVYGEGNEQDYGMRIYDPRIGKFLSVDPITRKYPELTPYQFASNRPIDGIDLDGLEYTRFEANPVEWLLHFGEGFWEGKGGVYEGVDWFNRSINPVGMISHGLYSTAAGEDLLTKQPVDRSTAFCVMSANLIMLAAGERLFFISPAAKIETQVMSGQMYKNGVQGAAGQIESSFGEQWGTSGLYSRSDKTTTLLGV